nr:reverse transcriptase domain-containing protein [Tanacetum cinerariifolium]
MTICGRKKRSIAQSCPGVNSSGKTCRYNGCNGMIKTNVSNMGTTTADWNKNLLLELQNDMPRSNTPEHIIPLRHDLGVLQFMGIGNQGEWPMPVWCRMFQQTLYGKAKACFDKLPPGSIDNWGSLQEKFLNRFGMLKACDEDPTEILKIDWKANYTLPHFKERCVSESNAIPNVPELMQISSFMSSHKCPELTKRFSDNAKGKSWAAEQRSTKGQGGRKEAIGRAAEEIKPQEK